MDNYLDCSLKKYLDDLASDLPAPGGGSASALVGSTGVALFSMVAGFTIGREKYRDVEEEVKELLQNYNSIRGRLDELVQEDALSYGVVSEAYKLPGNTEEEKKTRAEAIQEACKKALEVPLEIVSKCSTVLDTGRKLLEIGNKNLLSDVGVGALLLESALNGAAMNVNINLSMIKDAGFVREKRDALEKLIRGKKEVKDGIVEGMNF